MGPVRRALVVAALMQLACSSSASLSPDGASSPDGAASPDGASGGFCSANVPIYQACNTLANIAPTIGPTCANGTMPVGTGGTIVDGTYVLTSVTYYNVTSCGAMIPGSETIAISGGCIQYVLGGDNGFTGTASVSFTVQGNNITSRLTCADYLNLDGGLTNLDVLTKTFTATPTTYTLFTPNSAAGNSNPDHVDVFTKQ